MVVALALDCVPWCSCASFLCHHTRSAIRAWAALRCLRLPTRAVTSTQLLAAKLRIEGNQASHGRSERARKEGEEHCGNAVCLEARSCNPDTLASG